MNLTTYPKSPAAVPKQLTKLSPSYHFRAFLAILSVLLFFVLYFALVVAMAYLVYWAIIYDMYRVKKFTLLLKVGAIAGAVMLFAFTLKFIFKLQNPKIENRKKLDKNTHPELFSFVEKLCKETGAPRPKSIYVDPDVNAYVAYSNMWLSLILPVRKDLTIGMGLLNCLNLSEFKAVAAHEFGHFAQRSMKIGSYIISANTIIHDMIFTRDKWDDLLAKWREADFRLSAAAWLITPIIWLIRQILNLFYTFLNIMHSSLSREMEFNADKVAVSVAGSEAIISALWKLDGGSESWNATINNAYLSAQKELYTKNLYEHNTLMLNRATPAQKEALEALPVDSNGGRVFFAHSEMSTVGMYASHPPNDHREKSAKNPFIECAADERSPWILFSNVKALQEEMTLLVYEKYLGKTPSKFASVSEFEKFVKAEEHGNDLMAEYQNTFVSRFLYIPEEEEVNFLLDRSESSTDDLASLKEELSRLMKPVQEVESMMVKAQQIAEGTSKESSFTYSGITYDKKKLKEGYDALFQKREQLFNEHFKNWDTSFCAYHLSLARRKGREAELWKLYTQHRELCRVYKAIVAVRNTLFGEFKLLQQRSDLKEEEVTAFCNSVINKSSSLNTEMDSLNNLEFVPLPNIQTVTELKNAIVEGGAFPKLSGAIFENGGFALITQALDSAVVHCQRLDQKSIGYILSVHAELHSASKEKAGASSGSKPGGNALDDSFEACEVLS